MKLKITHSKLKSLIAYLAVTGLAALIACDDDESPVIPGEDPVVVNYVISNVAGEWPDRTTYLQGTENLDFTEIGTENAVEMSNFSSLWSDGRFAFMTTFGAPATMRKFSFNDAGIPVEAGSIAVPGANTFSTVVFAGENEAYGSVGGGLARLVVFDPEAMAITGEVNLQPIQKAEATSVWYLGAAQRGDKLFWAVHYQVGSAALHDSAYVAVIDREQRTVDKLISDGRTSRIFAAGATVKAVAEDSNGDLYFQGRGSGDAPSGILRIRNNESEFDPDYFFDLNEATGKECYGLYHFGNGLTFTCRLEDEDDPWEFNGPSYRYYKIDLQNRQSLGPVEGLPKVYGASAVIMRQFDEHEILFSVSTDEENAIYSYSIQDGSINKKFDMIAGSTTGLSKIGE